jgi:putative transposase
MPNTYSQIYLHFVFSPKNRQALLIPLLEIELFKYITGIVKNLDQQLIAINGMPDHCHLLVRLRPAMAPSKFIQAVKTNSSRWINEKKFMQNKFSWQVGGGIFSVSPSGVKDVIKYIENQKNHHKKTHFRDEYLQLLEKSGIKFEKEYLLEFFKK